LRGGAWSSVAWDLRAGYRFDNKPGLRNDFVGFRLARTSV